MKRRELVRRHRIEQHQSGNLVGILSGVDHGVQTTGGVPHQNKRTRLAGSLQQHVQVGGNGVTVLRFVDIVTPALAGAVIGAHASGPTHRAADTTPQRRQSAETVLQHDGRAAEPTQSRCSL